MAGQVDIVNRALIKLGGDTILALDASSKRARVMGQLFDETRDGLIRSFLWGFAMERIKLNPLADAPAFGYSKQFLLPGDFLRPVMVDEFFVGPSMNDYRNSDESLYSIEGNKILTDLASPLPLRYLKRVTDYGLMPGDFVEVLACELALAACQAITQSETKKESIRKDRADALRSAVRVSAIEKPPSPIPDDTWVLARLGT